MLGRRRIVNAYGLIEMCDILSLANTDSSLVLICVALCENGICRLFMDTLVASKRPQKS